MIVPCFSAYHLHKKLALSRSADANCKSERCYLIAWRASIFYCFSHSSRLPLFPLLPHSNIQGEVKSEEGPEWNILRDDFMMGASMKDWDKESDGEGNTEQGGGLKQEDDSDWMKLKTIQDNVLSS